MIEENVLNANAFNASGPQPDNGTTFRRKRLGRTTRKSPFFGGIVDVFGRRCCSSRRGRSSRGSGRESRSSSITANFSFAGQRVASANDNFRHEKRLHPFARFALRGPSGKHSRVFGRSRQEHRLSRRPHGLQRSGKSHTRAFWHGTFFFSFGVSFQYRVNRLERPSYR